jgi:hypothetical protein
MIHLIAVLWFQGALLYVALGLIHAGWKALTRKRGNR